MTVNGWVKYELYLNVYDLETEAVDVDEGGNVTISDDGEFFSDWLEHWERGVGELLGADSSDVELKIEKDDDEG